VEQAVLERKTNRNVKCVADNRWIYRSDVKNEMRVDAMLCVVLVRIVLWHGLEICASPLQAELSLSQAATEACFLLAFGQSVL